MSPPSHLPALVPPTATLLHRAQGTLGLLRKVVQESSAEYWYKRGKEAAEQEEWEEAISNFSRCLQINSIHIRALSQISVALVHQNKLQEATAYIVSAYDLSEHGGIIHYFYDKFLLERFEVEHRPDNNVIYSLALSIIYIENGKSKTAHELMSTIYSVASEQTKLLALWHRISGALWSETGGIFNRESQDQKALVDYNRAIEIESNNFITYCKRARTKFTSGDTSGALADCDTCIKLAPEYPTAYKVRGDAMSKFGNVAEAIDSYSKAIVLDEFYFNAYERRAGINLHNYNYRDAKLDFKKLIEIEEFGVSHLRIALVVHVNKNLPYHKVEVLELYDMLINEDDSWYKNYLARSVARAYFGDKSGAAIDLKKASELEKNHLARAN